MLSLTPGLGTVAWRLTSARRGLAHEEPPAHPASLGRHDRDAVWPRKTRAIFDRYNIINEQELLEAGDQLVAYLEQHAQAQAPRGRAHPTGGAAVTRTAPPLRLVRRTTA